MILYPAIDLKDGKCVRLVQGDMNRDTIYNEDPGAQAAEWAREGFSWVHVVDLNGAVDGVPKNHAAVRAILKEVDIPVQLGGGIRNMQQADMWLQEGVSRIILGTALVKDPDFAAEACNMFPGQVVMGIDARGGMVATEGWVEASDIPAVDMAKRAEDMGAAAIIYTDIDRDGTGKGVNIPQTVALAQAVQIPVIASGGIGSLEDLQKVSVAANDSGIEGVIVGKALYDGRVEPGEALAVAGGMAV